MLRRVSKKLGFLILFLSFLLIFTSLWILNTFGLVTFEEILFAIMVPQEGLNTSIIYNFIIDVLLKSLILTLVLYYLILKDYKLCIEIDLNIKKFNLRKIIYPFNSIFRFLMILLIFSGSLYYTLSRLDIIEYIENQITKSTFIEDVYVDTKNTEILFEKGKRNLIYIFLESMESSFTSTANGGTQDKDVIERLSMLADKYISFSHTDMLGGAQAVPGTTWTVGAMVAHTSGLPLKLSINGNSYGKYNTFLPGDYTLGDLLADNGYNQMIMFGSDAAFGGRDDYFAEHGNYEIFDFYTAVSRGKMALEDRVWWGFEDKDLFTYAKEEIIKLSEEDKPFNFTMLTADTHFEDGYLSSSCNANLGDQYSNVISCSSDMVYKFVEWIQKQDFYENTTIVIVGDHLTMDVDYLADIDSNYVRTIYNVFINSVSKTDNTDNRVFTTLDLFPTTLAAMGVKINGDRLALGTNLFSERKTIAEEYGLDVLRDELDNTSQFYNENFLYNKSS